MTDQRLKGDETYRQCPYCRKPIRDDQDSIGINLDSERGATLHSECFDKRCKEITGGTAMEGTQTVADPITGELMDEGTMKDALTDTTISGKILLTERCRLGEYVRVTVLAQVRQVAQVLDDKGFKGHVQKFVVTSVEDVKRGAI
jgi:hypothetical protein